MNAVTQIEKSCSTRRRDDIKVLPESVKLFVDSIALSSTWAIEYEFKGVAVDLVSF